MEDVDEKWEEFLNEESDVRTNIKKLPDKFIKAFRILWKTGYLQGKADALKETNELLEPIRTEMEKDLDDIENILDAEKE